MELSECHLRLATLNKKLQTKEKEQEDTQMKLRKDLDDANMLMQKKTRWVAYKNKINVWYKWHISEHNSIAPLESALFTRVNSLFD